MSEPVETALEPDLPICDPHHHLWDNPRSTYLVGELLDDIAGHRVVETVFVECMSEYRDAGPEELRPVGETEFVERVAAESDRAQSETRVCAATVSYADLTLGEGVRPVLEAHVEASPRFRGIRHASGWDSSDDVRDSHTQPTRDLLSRSDFRAGFRALGELGLSFDAWLYHPQIPELTELARANPDVPIVLDHIGGPLGIGPYEGKREEIFTRWKDDIRDLARCPNVAVKLGGLLMPINGWGFHELDHPPGSEQLASVTAPYYLHCIEHFGPDRCMFESNFPVDRTSCSYATLWNSFKRLTRDFSADERAALFRDTARSFYRIDSAA